jgi:methylenetetrahydrofolate reductase (NADPH)
MRRRGLGQVPLIGNVYLLSAATARFFRTGAIPGVTISDALFENCERQASSPDRGQRYFHELAAKQVAIFRGLSFAGAYLGGIHSMKDLRAVLDIEAGFSPDDWREFAREIQYPLENEFYYFPRDEVTRLADASAIHPAYEKSLADRKTTGKRPLSYRFSKWIHDLAFTPGAMLYKLGQRIYSNSSDPSNGPALLRIVEHASKSALFGCKDCGDCSLPDIAFLCPESQCAKNQRNGPCGGTRDGKCEVEDFECIWSRVYDRLKYEGHELQMLDHAPVIQDESLRGTSSWANSLLGRDHSACGKTIGHPATGAAPDSRPSNQSTDDVSKTPIENQLNVLNTNDPNTESTSLAR